MSRYSGGDLASSTGGSYAGGDLSLATGSGTSITAPLTSFTLGVYVPSLAFYPSLDVPLTTFNLLVYEPDLPGNQSPKIRVGQAKQFQLTVYAPSIAQVIYVSIDVPVTDFALTPYEPSLPIVGFAYDYLEIIDAAKYGVGVTVTDSLEITDSLLFQGYFMVFDSIELTDTVSANRTVITAASDSVVLDISNLYAIDALLSDGVSLTDSSLITASIIAQTADTLSLLGSALSNADIYAQIVEGLVLSEVLPFAIGLTASDALELSETLPLMIDAYVSATEDLELSDSALATFVFVALAEDALEVSDSATRYVDVYLDASDSLTFLERLPLGDDDFDAWCVNTDTLGATQYTNFQYNSILTFDGVMYGVTETGLYELEGTDDDGTDIDSYATLGMMHFGSSEMKHVPRAYLLTKAQGDVYLKTITDEHGARKERWYQISSYEGDTADWRRVKLGRGVTASRWALKVESVSGSQLDVKGMRVTPVILRRRKF